MEKLRVKNLGPIKDFEMETNRLTVLIGPQASGKSLMAQMLYFYRGIEGLLAERFDFSRCEDSEYKENVLEMVLNELRAAPFVEFCGNRTSVSYLDEDCGGYVYAINVNYARYLEYLKDDSGCYGCPEYKGYFEIGEAFRSLLDDMFGRWLGDKSSVSRSMVSNQLYIPNERSMYSRFAGNRQSVLYYDFQPLVFRKFAETLEAGKRFFYRGGERQLPLPGLGSSSSARARGRLLAMQRAALGGEIIVEGKQDNSWTWLTNVGDKQLMLPLSSMSSGQLESWPFFALALVEGLKQHQIDFYFEEPETHLHPNAQVEVVKTIAYLISRGHRFVITTHSPFILYVINNLIQAHIAYDGNPPEGEFSINPDHVAAYCMGENPHSIVDEETRLLDLDEIDDVFDDIGEYFQNMLDVAYAKRKKAK